MNQQPLPIRLQRWMVLALIPAAFLAGYVLGDDARIARAAVVQRAAS